MQGARWWICIVAAVVCIVVYHYTAPHEDSSTACKAPCGNPTCGGCSICGADLRLLSLSDFEKMLPLPGQIDLGPTHIVSERTKPIAAATPVASASATTFVR